MNRPQLLSLTCVVFMPVTLLGQRPLLLDNFERNRGDLVGDLSRNDHLEVVKGEGTGGSKAIEATYQGNENGSARIVARTSLKRPGKEFTLCYDVKFAKDFDFAKGGKLPGLGPEKPVTGGDPMRSDGWSARLMWQKEGGVISYIYHQDQPGKYGDSKKANIKLETGKFHAITLQVTINSAGDQADGRVAIYIDGTKQIEHPAIRLRGEDRKKALIASVPVQHLSRWLLSRLGPAR